MLVLLVTFCFVFQGVLAEQGEDLNDDRKFVMDQLRILSEEVKFLKSTMASWQESEDSHGETKRLILDNGQSNPDPVLNQETTVGTAPVGSTYVRWGRTTCPDGAELVYNGFAGGSHYTESGGGANYICLHSLPEWGHYVDGVQAGAYVHGTEYQFGDMYSNGGSAFAGGKNVNNEDVSCAVCYVPRSSNIMIPSRLTCPDPSWHKEYSGYLAAEYHSYHRTENVCLDSDPEKLQAGSANDDGRFMYLVEAICGSLPCPPYVHGRELTCVVCSKQHRNTVHDH